MKEEYINKILEYARYGEFWDILRMLDTIEYDKDLMYLVYTLMSVHPELKVRFRRPLHNLNWKDEYKSVHNIKNRMKISPFKNTEEEENSINELLKYINIDEIDFPKSSTHLIKDSDELFINKDGKLCLKAEEFNLISTLNKDKIVYGQYPTHNLSDYESLVMNLLYKFKRLKRSEKRINYILDGKYVNMPVFEYNGNKYIRYKVPYTVTVFDFETYSHQKIKTIYKWRRIEPLEWKINKENNTLELINDIKGLHKLTSKELAHFLKTGFKETAFEPYKMTKEEEEIKEKLSSDPKISKFKLIEKHKKNEKKKEIVEESYESILQLLKELKNKSQILKENGLNSIIVLNKIIRVSNEYLLIENDGHFEINPDFIPYIEFIDFSDVSCENLKLSGLNLKATNLLFNPQEIYNKDLSNSIIGAHNVTSGDFDDVNLCGSIVSDQFDEFESNVFDKAITDGNTRLPNRLKK